MNHYRVKFTHFQTKKTVFGIVDNHTKEAMVAAEQGFCIVEDAVFPKRYKVAESDITDIPLSVENIQNGDEYDKYVTAAFDEAQATSAGLEGLQVGNLFSLSVADGMAWYVVTKVNKKSCHIEWRGFCADRYMERHFGFGGTFPIDEVRRIVEGAQLFSNMYAKKTG